MNSRSSSTHTACVHLILQHTLLPMDLVKLINSYIPLHIYLFGAGSSFVLNINTLLPSEREWIPIPTISFGSFNASAAVWNDRYVFVTGGTDKSHWSATISLNTVKRFDLVRYEWKTVASMPLPQYEHSAITCQQQIYVIDHWGKSVQVYNPLTDTWRLLTSSTMNISRRWGHAVAWKDSRIYVFGGNIDTSAKTEDISSCEYFDVDVEKWISVADMHYPRRSARALVMTDNCIAVMGGYDNRNIASVNVVELYNPITDVWSIAAWRLPAEMIAFPVYKLDDNRIIVDNFVSSSSIEVNKDGIIINEPIWESIPKLKNNDGFTFV